MHCPVQRGLRFRVSLSWWSVRRRDRRRPRRAATVTAATTRCAGERRQGSPRLTTPGWTAETRNLATAGEASGSALVAQGIEHRFPKPGVAGPNPAGGTDGCVLLRLMLDVSASVDARQCFG